MYSYSYHISFENTENKFRVNTINIMNFYINIIDMIKEKSPDNIIDSLLIVKTFQIKKAQIFSFIFWSTNAFSNRLGENFSRS